MAASHDQETVLLMYQQLITRDFDDTISMKAAAKHPNDMQKAVDFILNSQATIATENLIHKQDTKSETHEEDLEQDQDFYRMKIEVEHLLQKFQ